MLQEQDEEPGPFRRAFDYIFYTQKRVGKGGKIFTLPKFRTMKREAPNPHESQKLYHIFNGYQDDSRLTKIGKFLREYYLDEIPQFIWNVLIECNMNVFGYRPVTPEEHIKLPDNLAELRLEDTPGYFGPWLTIDDSTDEKRIDADLEYLIKKKNYPVVANREIFCGTIRKLFSGKRGF